MFQRVDWFREVFRYWRESPVFGHGLRYWYVDPTVPFVVHEAGQQTITVGWVAADLSDGTSGTTCDRWCGTPLRRNTCGFTHRAVRGRRDVVLC